MGSSSCHAIDQRVVTALGKDDVQIAVTVEIAQADVCRRLRRRLERDERRETTRRSGARELPKKQDEGEGHWHAAHSTPCPAIEEFVESMPTLRLICVNEAGHGADSRRRRRRYWRNAVPDVA